VLGISILAEVEENKVEVDVDGLVSTWTVLAT
jgi:hypothetical protein